jgi:hypothetical protein
MMVPRSSIPARQAAKTTLFAAGRHVGSRKKRHVELHHGAQKRDYLAASLGVTCRRLFSN